MNFTRFLWEWEDTKHFLNLKSVIKAKTSDIKNFLDKNATKKGAKSWLFVPPGSDNKICLVAHIDVIFETPQPKKIIKRKHGEKREWTSPQGISGDDRCGVWALLHIYRNMAANKRPILLFTDEEETGLFGAKEAVKVFKNELKEVTYFIEIDRKGKDDMVFYNYDAEEFRKHIGKHGFKDQPGMTSDIKVLGKTFKKSSVNVSAGYYGQHTKEEYIVIKELMNTIDKVKGICIKNEPLSPEAAKLPKAPKWTSPYKGSSYNEGGWEKWDEYFGFGDYQSPNKKEDKFKKGETVKIIKYKGNEEVVGKIGKITAVDNRMTFYKYKVTVGNITYSLSDEEIEKVENKELTKTKEDKEAVEKWEKEYWENKAKKWKEKDDKIKAEVAKQKQKEKDERLDDWEKRAREYQKEIDKKKGIE